MRPSERALRRAVAQLAAMRPEDAEAVLSGLDDQQRQSVEDLLTSYRGEPGQKAEPKPEAEASESANEPVRIEGLSPWLVMRLENRTQAGSSRAGSALEMSTAEARQAGLIFTLTPTTFEALRSAVEELKRSASAPPKAQRRRRVFWPRRVGAEGQAA